MFKEKRKASPLLKMLTVLVMLTALGLIFFGNAPMLGKASVENHLKSMDAYLRSKGAEQRLPLGLSWGNITESGMLLNKKVVVENLAFNVGAAGAPSESLSTPRAEITAKMGTAYTLIMTFPEPWTLTNNGTAERTITFPEPPIYTMQKGLSGEEHDLRLPQQFTIASATNPQDLLQVALSSPPMLRYNVGGDRASLGSKFTLDGLSVKTPDGKELYTLQHLDVVTTETVEGDKRRFNVELALDELRAAPELGDPGPFSVSISADGSTPTDPAKMDKEMDLNLKHFTFQRGEVELQASGTITQREDDSLPYGSLEVKIDQFDSLLVQPELQEKDKQLILELAKLVTGEDASALKLLSFPVKREKLGNLMVGQASFDQLLGAVLMGGGAQIGAAPTEAPVPTPVDPAAPVAPAPVAPAAR